MQRTFLVMAGVLLAATSAAAQTGQRWSIQGSGLYTGLYGDAFRGFDDGFGGELQIRLTPSALSVGGGIQYTTHNTRGEGSDVLTKVKLAGVFIEPRYVIDAGSSTFAPYISGRFAFSQMSFDFGGVLTQPGFEIDLDKPSGPTINGGGGLLFRLSNRANLDLGVTYGFTAFKDIEGVIRNNNNGQSAAFAIEVGSGTNLVFRAGLAIGLGG